MFHIHYSWTSDYPMRLPPLQFLDEKRKFRKWSCWSSQREWGVTWHSFLWKPVTFLCQSASLWPLWEGGEGEPGQPFLHWGPFKLCCGTHTGEKVVVRVKRIRVSNLAVSSKVKITDLENWLFIYCLLIRRDYFRFWSWQKAQSPYFALMDLMVGFLWAIIILHS